MENFESGKAKQEQVNKLKEEYADVHTRYMQALDATEKAVKEGKGFNDPTVVSPDDFDALVERMSSLSTQLNALGVSDEEIGALVGVGK